MSAQVSYGIPPPAFRLPEETHVGMVRLQVSDLDRSIGYYEQVIGLRVHERTSESATLGVPSRSGTAAGATLLLSLHTREGVQPARRGAFGLYHFAILVPDRATLGRFATHMADIGTRLGMADHFVSEALYLWDPDGLGIEVYSDRPRREWRQHDRELVMTTEPLDIEGVMAAGGTDRWEGLPAGTTIGHVHLHVGSLEQAEAFYHRGLGLDKMVWSYPGALFLAAGGYHHHLGTNIWSPGPAAPENHARLLEWELVASAADAVPAVAQSLRAAGYAAAEAGDGLTVSDPWGTRLRVRSLPRQSAGESAREGGSSVLSPQS